MAATEPDRDTAFNDVQSVLLPPGEQATVTYSLSTTRSDFHLLMAAISKHVDMAYKIEMDGSEEWLASLPPTDIDNAQQTHIPPKRFQNDMEVTISNLGDVERRINIQIKGFERPPTVDEGGL